jgi:phosphotriesterase-related protein
MGGQRSSDGIIRTVLGDVNSAAAGITLPHEHVFLNMQNYFTEPADPSSQERADEPITLQNLHWVHYNHLSNRDNLALDDEELAAAEIARFRDLGGGTLADVTPINLGRNPEGLARVSERTGVSIVMGAGYYIDQSYAPELAMDLKSEDQVAEQFVREIREGVGNTRVRAGLIGEIGCSWPLTDNERKVLRGAAIAQQETGAAITIHPGHVVEAPFEIMAVLTNAGANPERVIMGHMELTMPIGARVERAKLAEIGCYLEFDQMGISELQMYTYRSWLPGIPYIDIASDGDVLSEIQELIAEGYRDSVLISMDVCLKTCLAAYGGPGYGHIQEVVTRMMGDKGFSEEEIATITALNPARAITLSGT